MAKSPQEMQKVGIGQQGSVRFQGAQAVQTDPSFLKTYQSFKTAREQQDAENLKFLTKDFDNKAEALRQQAQGNLAMSEGINSFEEHGKQKKLLADSYQKLVDKAPEEFKPYLQQRADDHINKYGSFSIPYMAGQANKVREETDKTYLANTIRYAMEMSGFEDYLAVDAKVHVEMAAEDAARRKYGDSPLLVENAKRVAVSEMYLSALKTQASYGDMKKAENILNRFSEDFTPEDRMKAEKALKSARDDQATRDALDAAEMAITRYPEQYAAQEEFIAMTAKDSKDYQAKMSILKLKNKTAEEQKKKEVESVLGKMNDEYAKTGTVSRELILQLPADKRAEIVDKVSKSRGGMAVTNLSLYGELTDSIILSPLNKVQDINLRAYAHEISADHMEKLESMKQERLKLLASERQGVQKSTIKSAYHIINNVAVMNGIRKGSVEYGKLVDLGMQEHERLKDTPAANSQREMEAAIYGAYKKSTIKTYKSGGERQWLKPSTWWSGGAYTEMPETLQPNVSHPATTPYREAFRKSYINKLRSEGKPLPSQEELLKIEDYMVEQRIREGKIIIK